MAAICITCNRNPLQAGTNICAHCSCYLKNFEDPPLLPPYPAEQNAMPFNPRQGQLQPFNYPFVPPQLGSQSTEPIRQPQFLQPQLYQAASSSQYDVTVPPNVNYSGSLIANQGYENQNQNYDRSIHHVSLDLHYMDEVQLPGTAEPKKLKNNSSGQSQGFEQIYSVGQCSPSNPSEFVPNPTIRNYANVHHSHANQDTRSMQQVPHSFSQRNFHQPIQHPYPQAHSQNVPPNAVQEGAASIAFQQSQISKHNDQSSFHLPQQAPYVAQARGSQVPHHYASCEFQNAASDKRGTSLFLKGPSQPTQYFSPNQGAVGSMNLQQMAAQQSPLQSPRRFFPAQPPSTSFSQAFLNVAGNAPIIDGQSNRFEKKHQCPYCRDKRYTHIGGLRDHFKNDHSQLKFCDVYPCGREFDTDEKLREHKRMDHTQEEIDDLTPPNGMTFCPFCKELWSDGGGISSHVEKCDSRPKGQDVLICEFHPKNMYFGSAAEKTQHDDKVHKNRHHGFMSSLTG